MAIDPRKVLANEILTITDIHRAECVTITLDRDAARELARDLEWCTHSTGRKYKALSVRGNQKGHTT